MNLRDTYEWLHLNEEGYGWTNHGRYAVGLAAGCTNLLDVGGGFTPYAFDVKTRFKLKRAAVLDISEVPRQMQEARGIEFHRGEAQRLPFEDDEFDLVTAFDVLEHIPGPELHAAVSEIGRVAKRKAIVSVGTAPSVKTVDGCETNLHPSLHPIDWWKAMLAEQLGMVTVEPRGPFYYLCVHL